MLNYILPPIIIIVSVSILIMFLFRKAAQIPAGDFIEDEIKREEKNSVKIFSVMGEWGLKFLERLMHHSKLLSLKFHNVSNVWFQTIREKRKRSADFKREAEEKRIENQAIERMRIEKEIAPVVDVFSREEIARPMIRPNVTMPQKRKIQEKNQLEDALIKRIAINPKDIEAYERLGDYYLENENFQDSLACFRQVLKLSPAHHKARLRIRRLERMK